MNAGIAVGPILFVIAALALIAMVVSSNIGSFGAASTVDRIDSELPSQANLIHTKLNECNLKYATPYASAYPNTSGAVTSVSSLNCAGDPVGQQNIWTGLRPTLLPPPTSGFAAWNYVGTSTNGSCIYTAPTVSNPSSDPRMVDALTRSAKKFAHQTTCNNSSIPCTSEVLYDPASSSQKFVMWIALPAPASTPDSHCLP